MGNSRGRALVLGGTSGIGAGVAIRLYQNRDLESVSVRGIEHFNVEHFAVLLACVESIRPTHVVYSVGVNQLDWLDDIHPTDFREMMTANVWGFLNTIKALSVVGDPCSVVLISSDAARRPMRTSSIYCASKAAAEMAMRVASREKAAQGWRINAVAPGKVADTPMTERVDARVMELRGWTKDEAEQYEDASSALGRPVTVAEVASVVEQVLMSDVLAWTGDVISVNGGRA